jgi:signal transduction histidine kinase
MAAAQFSIRGDIPPINLDEDSRGDDERISISRDIERLEQAKAAAEQTTARLLALQKMTVALSDATNQIAVAEIIVDHLGLMLPDCRPIVATVSRDREYIECVRDDGPNTPNFFSDLPLTTRAPITDAIRTKTVIYLNDPEAIQKAYPDLPRLEAEEIGMIMAVPFVVDGQAIGVLAIRFSHTEFRKHEDYDFILHVAHTCTQSLERVRLHEGEKAARGVIDMERRRLGLLAETGAVLNASLDASAITDALAHVVVPHFADFCIVHRRDDDGFPRVENVVHENPEQQALLYRFVEAYPLRSDHAAVEIIKSGKTLFIEQIDEKLIRELTATEHQSYVELFHGIAITSIVVVPMISRGETLGLLTFGTAKNRFQDADVLFAEEIAHRTVMALNNARLYHEAQEANRVKDEFLGVISHELRTPLNAILGWARMLRTGAVREGAQPRALEAIERNASHQARLIDDLLDASRITAGKLRLDATIIELGPVVESAVQSVLPGATAKGIRLQTSCETQRIPVFADASRLQQIIWNLLSNAIKFTSKDGSIDVVVRREGDEAVIRISDNGRGIRPELIPHIFERFRQGDGTLTRNSGGLGLGLSIVRHLVEAHGGTVDGESPGADMGATFFVRLPISKPKTITPPKPIPTVPKHDPRKLTGLGILVVDDEPDAREILEEVLTLAGATIKSAADAAEALRILSDFIPDVIISDLAMPGEDGLSLIRKIRARSPNRVATIPAIALTAYTRTEDRVRALNAGFQLHVPKPVDPTELVATVASLRTVLVS